MKDEFYESLDKAYGECPKQDVKIVIGDTNAQIGNEDFFRLVIGTESLHSVTNDNGLRLVTFAAARGMAISSTVIRGIIDQRGNIDRNDSSHQKFVLSFIDETFPNHEWCFSFLYS